jgi:Uma2 family endonuclease
MVMQARKLYTPEEYLTLERAAVYKSEYLNGEIYAMSGGTPNHSEIAVSVGSELRTQLKRTPCHVFSSDLKIKTTSSSLFSYPDVSVICGQPQFHDAHQDVVTNPVVIVEVLSDSTEAYDRGRKFFQYRQIDTLMDYILISQKEPYIDHFTKHQDGRWAVTTVVGLSSSLRIASIDCTLLLSEIYDKIVFDSE